jgi:hypothetical protein
MMGLAAMRTAAISRPASVARAWLAFLERNVDALVMLLYSGFGEPPHTDLKVQIRGGRAHGITWRSATTAIRVPATSRFSVATGSMLAV